MKIEVKADYRKLRENEYNAIQDQLDEIWRLLVHILNNRALNIRWNDLPESVRDMLEQVQTVKEKYPRTDKKITFTLENIRK